MTHEAKSRESEHGALTLIRENSEAAAADRALSIASPSAHDRRQTTRARIWFTARGAVPRILNRRAR